MISEKKIEVGKISKNVLCLGEEHEKGGPGDHCKSI
jgi:hypothetical protein